LIFIFKRRKGERGRHQLCLPVCLLACLSILHTANKVVSREEERGSWKLFMAFVMKQNWKWKYTSNSKIKQRCNFPLATDTYDNYLLIIYFTTIVLLFSET
jgi:hypothetical protein